MGLILVCHQSISFPCHCSPLSPSPTTPPGFYVQPNIIRFIREPEDLIVCEGCSVELTCEIPLQETAADLPIPTLEWLVNGTNIGVLFPDIETSSSQSSTVSSKLRISNAGLEHAGLYRCLVRDGEDNEDWCDDTPCYPTLTISREARLHIVGE